MDIVMGRSPAGRILAIISVHPGEISTNRLIFWDYIIALNEIDMLKM